MYKTVIKAILDFILALIGVLLLSPLFIIIVILMFLNNKGVPFFLQKRPGKNEKIFSVIKFKTMTDEKGRNGDLLPDSDRLTPLGKFIRKTSLDEIPQLINVLKGDMSLIGPRPLLPEYLSLYSEEQKKRHNVKPGITGWAQVNGRNAISWEKKFKFDVEYTNKQSFFFDFKILLLTVKKVFIRDGINQEGFATSTSFKGSK